MGKVSGRFVNEMLAQIGRSLEEPGLLKKTEKRLSCNLNRKGPAGTVQDNVLRLAAERIGKNTLRTIAPAISARRSTRKAKAAISSS